MKKNILSWSARTRDLLVALCGIIILSPLLLFITIWIKSDSKGPIFYRGERIGKNGKPFNILKFRTMYETPESYRGPKVTGNGDPRITKVGKWLRDSKINEIPQLWNVLIGEMSIVGPRPEDPKFVNTWPPEIRQEILSIRPGITSPASVLYRDEENMLTSPNTMDQYLGIIQPSKLRLDQLYVRHRSFLGDLDIIMWTILVLLPGLSKYQPPERLLYVGLAQRAGLYLANWFVIDFFVAILAITATGLFWRLFSPIDIGIIPSIIAAIEFAVVFTIVGAVFGIQKIHWSKASPADVFSIGLSSTIATIILYIFRQFLPAIPPQILLSAAITTFLGYVIARFRFRLVTGFATRFLNFRKGGDVFKERVLIVGSGDAGLFAAWLLENSRDASHFHVVGFIDDDLIKQGGRVRGIPILGGRNDIANIAKKNDVGIILFAIHNISPTNKNKIIQKCNETQAQLVMFPDVLNSLNSAIHNNKNEKSEREVSKSSNNHQQIFKKLDAVKDELDQGNLEQCIHQIDEIATLLKEEEHADVLE